MNDIVQKSFKEEIREEIRQESNNKIRNQVKKLIVTINAEMKKRDVWIERRQNEKEELAKLEEEVYKVAEAGDKAALVELNNKMQFIASTSDLRKYHERYGKKILEIGDPLDEMDDCDN